MTRTAYATSRPTTRASATARSSSSATGTSATHSGASPASTRARSSRSEASSAEPLGLVERRPQRHRVRLGDPVDEVLEHRAQRGERGAELVAHVGHQLAPLAVDGGQVLGHPVEGPRQLSHLVARGRGHPAGVVAPGHPPGGGGHLAQRRGHPHRQQLGHAQGQGHGDRHAEPERHSPAGTDRRDDRGHGDADRHEQPELDLDRRDLVQQRAAHVAAPGSRA